MLQRASKKVQLLRTMPNWCFSVVCEACLRPGERAADSVDNLKVASITIPDYTPCNWLMEFT